MRLVFSVGILCRMVCMCCSFACAQVSQADQNVNMVSGTDWTNGDPFLERQNEPSITVSTRNNLHLLAGNNDDRTVDLPGFLGIQVIWDPGDAQPLNSLDRRAIRGQNSFASGSCATRRRDHWLRNASVVSARAKTFVKRQAAPPDRRFLFRVLVEIPRKERTMPASLAT